MTRSLLKRMKKLETQLTPVEPFKIEVCREVDKQPLFSIGEGRLNQLLARESQVTFTKWFGEHLDGGLDSPALLIGDRRSGTSWAGLVATVSLMATKRMNACVYCRAGRLRETHELIRKILPREWVGQDCEEEGTYRLPRRRTLQVAVFSRPTTWPTNTPGIVMINDYSSGTDVQLEAALRGALH